MTQEQLIDLQELIDKFHPTSSSEAELKRRCRKAFEWYTNPYILQEFNKFVQVVEADDRGTALFKMKYNTPSVQSNNTFIDNEQK